MTMTARTRLQCDLVWNISHQTRVWQSQNASNWSKWSWTADKRVYPDPFVDLTTGSHWITCWLIAAEQINSNVLFRFVTKQKKNERERRQSMTKCAGFHETHWKWFAVSLLSRVIWQYLVGLDVLFNLVSRQVKTWAIHGSLCQDMKTSIALNSTQDITPCRKWHSKVSDSHLDHLEFDLKIWFLDLSWSKQRGQMVPRGKWVCQRKICISSLGWIPNWIPCINPISLCQTTCLQNFKDIILKE